ncbi:class I SAM-dependent RNA methyltransferase [Williamsia soli]|uniref:class I SAM-dependent RNA methyltransferase n=1 Tax=Williamsia soli TaxID=364929 RepID=UPI0027DE5D46|nr:TRAM domain-containing protein [Williamsia soli]
MTGIPESRPRTNENSWFGSEFELATERLGHGGVCVGRHDGRVVFVRHALPGERLRVRVSEDRGKGFVRAEITEIVEASEHRIDAACPAGAPGGGAGCCDLSHTTGAHARELKAGVLGELLSRMGGVRWDGEMLSLDAAAGDQPETGWRVRERLIVDSAGVAGMHAHQSHSVIRRLDCAQPIPGLLDGIDLLEDLQPGADLVVTAGDDGVRHIASIAGLTPAGDVRRARRTRTPSGGRRKVQRDRAQRSAARDESILEGGPTVRRTVAGRSWDLPITGFWQAHRHAAAGYSTAVRTLLRDAGLPRSVVVWDLYGGAGVLAGAVIDENDQARGTARVHIVEADAAAVAAAQETFADDHRVQVHRGNVATSLATLPTPDVVILDPPRAGAGRAVVEQVVAAAPSYVVAVGCDPATFARDLGDYMRGGYEVVTLLGFDAFPLTHHLEAIALLRPSSAPATGP